MAESKSTHLFFVYAPDYTDADGVARRLSVREKHLEGAKRITQQGLLRTSSTPPRGRAHS